MAKNNTNKKNNQQKNNVEQTQEIERVSRFFNLPRKVVFIGMYALAGLIIFVSFIFITWSNNRVSMPSMTFGPDEVTPQSATVQQIRRRYGFEVDLRADFIRLVGVAPNISSGEARFQARIINTGGSNVHNNQIQFRVVLGANWIGFQTPPSNPTTLRMGQGWTNGHTMRSINQQFPARRLGVIRIERPTAFLIISWESGVVPGQRTRHTYAISFNWSQFVDSCYTGLT